LKTYAEKSQQGGGLSAARSQRIGLSDKDERAEEAILD
jgi:hypothetical protein